MPELERIWELALDQPGSAGRATMRRAGGFVAFVVVVAMVVAMFARDQLPAYPQFATFHAGFVFVVDGIVAFLLFGQFVYRRLPSYVFLAAAYLFNALVIVPFLLAFPGALKEDGSVIGDAQSAIWLWHLWHLLFPLLVLSSLLSHARADSRPVAIEKVASYIVWSIAAVATLVVLSVVAVTVFHDALPVLITHELGRLTDTAYVIGGIIAAIVACALALSAWISRRRSVLHIWLTVALAAFLADVLVSLATSTRYSLGWYFGRVESIFAAGVLLLVFLSEINQLYRRLASTIGELYAANTKLADAINDKDALVTELRRREEEIQRFAYYDSVTELPNRRMLMDRLNHDLAQGKRHGHATAVLFLDLDMFKQINDTLGHDAGDALLHEVGVRLNHCVRVGDTVARLAGDEFVIVLPEISAQVDVEAVAHKIIERIHQPIAIAGQPLQISTSIGIAIAAGDTALDAGMLLSLADEAMYTAKKSGRNKFCVSPQASRAQSVFSADAV